MYLTGCEHVYAIVLKALFSKGLSHIYQIDHFKTKNKTHEFSILIAVE